MTELLGDVAETVGEAAHIAGRIGFPVRLSASFGLRQNRVAHDNAELRRHAEELLALSPTHEIHVERMRHELT